MRCLECGAEIAEQAQVCPRCGSWAPVDYRLYVAEDQAADAAHDVAGGLAPAALGASAGQQRPEPAPAGPESGAADPAAEAAQIRCPECGADSAEATEACARCGAPASYPPVAGDPAAAQRAGRSGPSWHRLITLGVAVALIVAGALAAGLHHPRSLTSSKSSVKSSAQSAPAAPSSSPASLAPTPWQASADELQAGDCLTGSDLGLGTNDAWPDVVTVVPCTQRHIAEVFFAGNAWPQSQAYPGDNAIYTQADNRCNTAFAAYDGTASDNSVFTYDYISPSGSDDWASGDRLLVCVAYDATSQYPGGAPVNYSIRGSGQ